MLAKPQHQSNSDKNNHRISKPIRNNRLNHDYDEELYENKAKTINPRTIAAKALDRGDVVEKIRTKIVERGGAHGIKNISKFMAIMDENGDKKLTREEFKQGLRDYGIDITQTELEQVFLYFDRDRNGFIDFEEFLIGLKGNLNDRRKKFVRMAFNILDKDKSGEITKQEILNVYDFNWHPEVRTGSKTVKEAAKEFLSHWDGNGDGMVTIDEFEDYYKGVSASIDDDDYFELMIRNAWRIEGGKGFAENTANKRVLVRNRDGTESIQTIKNELGMNHKDINDVRARLNSQQEKDSIANIEMFGGYDNRDKINKVFFFFFN
jgi:Ca2+-binding EF-hand superfamily protein